MRDRHRTTAFYIEMLLLVAVFTGVIMVLSGVFAAAREQSSKARELNGAVRLAENAAEIVAGTNDSSEMVELLGGAGSVESYPEGRKLLARYGSGLEPDPDGGFQVEITWAEKDGLVNYDIQVSWQGGEPVYELGTSVFYE